MLQPTFIALGPSILEVHVTHGNAVDVLRSCGLEATPWQRVPALDDLRRVFHAIGLDHTQVLESSLMSSPGDALFRLVPGSSTLAMLLAMPGEIRRHSTFGTWLDGSPLARRLISGLEVLPCVVKILNSVARPSVCLIISDHSARERFMVTVNLDEAPFIPLTDTVSVNSRIIVDSYELVSDPFVRSLEELCSSTHSSLYVSLGGLESLHEAVAPKIDLLLERGWVAALAGTQDQFRALEFGLSSRGAFHQTPRLITCGAGGMTGILHNEKVHVDAPKLLSRDNYPSGAGDTVAGVFFAGLAAQVGLEPTLQLARSLAALVLSRPQSWVINEARGF